VSSFVVPAWAWCLSAVLMLVLVAIDLIGHRHHQVDSRRRAIFWSVLWIAAALAFNVFVGVYFGLDAAEQFLGAYLLEKSLSLDNLFVFLVIFGALGIPRADQRRILTWGIIGALVTRGLFIAAGSAVLHEWHAITYVLGALLVVTAIKTLRSHDQPSVRPSVAWLKRRLPPFAAALIAIELTDVVFAIDSIPAAFAITEDTFLVYTSNVFAVLGLRALYIVLAGALTDLRYLHVGLAAVLAFAGGKMLAAPWLHVPPLASVAIVALCIGVAVIASVLATRRTARIP
jgi:predicted tellurium resistance membrane protein TerC